MEAPSEIPAGLRDLMTWDGNALIVHDSCVEVGDWHEDDMPASGLRWMADRIREAGARIRSGDKTDVPEELKALRRQRVKA